MKIDPKWEKIIEDWQSSSLSVTEYYRINKVNKSTFLTNRSRLGLNSKLEKTEVPKTKEEITFAEVLPPTSPIESGKSLKITLPNGLKLEVPL